MKFLFAIEPFLTDQELFKIKRLNKNTLNFVSHLNETRFKRINFINCNVLWKVYNYELFHTCYFCVNCKTGIKKYFLFQRGICTRYLQFCKCTRKIVKKNPKKFIHACICKGHIYGDKFVQKQLIV